MIPRIAGPTGNVKLLHRPWLDAGEGGDVPQVWHELVVSSRAEALDHVADARRPTMWRMFHDGCVWALFGHHGSVVYIEDNLMHDWIDDYESAQSMTDMLSITERYADRVAEGFALCDVAETLRGVVPDPLWREYATPQIDACRRILLGEEKLSPDELSPCVVRASAIYDYLEREAYYQDAEGFEQSRPNRPELDALSVIGWLGFDVARERSFAFWYRPVPTPGVTEADRMAIVRRAITTDTMFHARMRAQGFDWE